MDHANSHSWNFLSSACIPMRHALGVDTWPGMRMHLLSLPQFNREALEQQLPAEHGIQYKWMGKELGGLRKRDKASEANAGAPWPCHSYAHARQHPPLVAG